MLLDRLKLETARLWAAAWPAVAADPGHNKAVTDGLVALLTSDVLEHLPPSLQSVPPDPRDWLNARVDESHVLCVFDPQNALAGVMLLARPDRAMPLPEVHLGYLLAPSAWGQGYATELVSGLVSALVGQGPMRLVGGVDLDNPASARVLVKCGFQLDAATTTAETEFYTRTIA